MDDVVLKLSGIDKQFGGIKALSDMNFELRKAEIHAICGENGAGKSTLMKIVTGVYKPDRGKIFLNNEEVSIANPLDSFSKGIAIIYQETSLFEEMTVLENIFVNRELVKKAGPLSFLDYKAMKTTMTSILKRLDISIPFNEKIKNLGMARKQMIEIAKALVFKSRILILDEPTASLTQNEVNLLFTIIRDLKRNGISVAYISHRLEEIFLLCDRVTVIRDGHYISTRTTAETNKGVLVADMVGRTMDNYFPKMKVNAGDEILKVDGLGDKKLLHNIHFNAGKGEIIGFAGLIGSGRTELALALCGITGFTAGTIFLNGKPVRFSNYHQAMQNGVVYVSEDRTKYGIIVKMSIKNNIVMPQLKNVSTIGVIDAKKEYAVAERMKESIGIKAPHTDFTVMNLSGGNQQKVSLGKALALDPVLLILDEPTRGVDVNAKAEIHGIIGKMAAAGLTILLISSELPELIGMCDRIYVMKDGTIAGSFERNDFSQENILKIALDPLPKEKESL
ncbi:MAG: sugar ABC transporter ATP-binding protein [Treponema sp.]|jgi:ABC-type sugar transport system ATPase subunit|nr:sugar ABC transporter ATP-binding protein [Treponema sp.]